tara:strand:+ start:991 stop:1395 length:405 start_codon:yes stop_codon:yes gene_type:complete
MKEIDLNKIVQFEKAIAKKYGEEAIKNPKSSWTDEKEEKYLEQIKHILEKEEKAKEKAEKVEKDGFFLSKNLINKKSKRKCPTCGVYSFSMTDDVYMNKFECCYKCYILWVQGREKRWLTGWRPKKEQINGNSI